jgi:paraquat-inducible protein B
MTAAAEPLLTDQARFWVVRPELNTFNATDIETLVSGSYIQLEPGKEEGEEKRDFIGLEKPPAERSDEPGRVYVLKADKLSSISSGSLP